MEVFEYRVAFERKIEGDTFFCFSPACNLKNIRRIKENLLTNGIDDVKIQCRENGVWHDKKYFSEEELWAISKKC